MEMEASSKRMKAQNEVLILINFNEKLNLNNKFNLIYNQYRCYKINL